LIADQKIVYRKSQNSFVNKTGSMKRFLFFFLAISLGVSSSAQFVKMMKQKANVVVPGRKAANIEIPIIGNQPENVYVSNKSVLNDPVICVTLYDMQTTASNQNRVYLYPDGTIGATAIWSQQEINWTDRGTGYNYFDGTNWGSLPTGRVETIRTGWPEYHPFGSNGELIIAHEAGGPLVMNTRTIKGTGAWTQTILPALPAGVSAVFWPRVVTNGTNHTNIHIIALTEPTANGGTVYKGMNGALLYCHSLDSGDTWSDWIQPAGLDSTNYRGFVGDTYSFAEPHGDTLAFTIGDSFYDQLLLKSTDNGMSWTRTIIWHCPYDLGGNSPDFFYCPDGTNAIALDNTGMAHVVFGLTQDSGSFTSYYWHPLIQGIAYWNEHMSQLRQDLNPDSLFAKGQYVAWVKDTNVFHLPANVNLTYYDAWSLTSNPDLVIDNENKIFLVWSGETSLTDPNGCTLRHIYGRDGVIAGNNIDWHNDTLADLTGNWIQQNFAECVFPSASPTSDGYIYILFQEDEYGGSWILNINESQWDCQGSPDSNYMTFIKWEKPVWIGVNEKHERPAFSVGQNFPNPFNGLTKVDVYLQNAGDLTLTITSVTGQTMISIERTNVLPGVSEFIINGVQLAAGVYFYTVKQGVQSVTKKMVVE
jgi:hypothetical protein